MRRIILILVAFLATACGSFSATSQPETCPVHLPKGLPTGTPTENDRVVVRDIYCLGADPDTKFADWVAYKLDARIIGTPGADQDREWMADPDLDPAITLEPEDYRGAHNALGTDRGHLAPLASFRGGNWQQTNYLSNIVPQRSEFNQGVWADLENNIRKMARKETIYVITGTAYLETMPTLPGADEPHVIPSGLWTIVTSSRGTQAWFFDQDTTATDPSQGEIPVSELEAMIGIQFKK